MLFFILTHRSFFHLNFSLSIRICDNEKALVLFRLPADEAV